MRSAALSMMTATLCALAGCGGGNADFLTESRLENGLVIILPGIEGESSFNHDIRKGLVEAGIDRALPIHRWGRPIPVAGMILNQVDFLGNRLAAMRIAQMITAYQDAHPGKPVHLIGHSGGGGIAVFAVEALPEDRQVDGLVLLSASISSAYDLTKALKKCRSGVTSFYSRADVGLLVIGTIIAGTVDGTHGPGAGAVGFDLPREDAAPAKKAAYAKLYQVELTQQMTGGGDTHTGATSDYFVAEHVAPLLVTQTWPATSVTMATPRP